MKKKIISIVLSMLFLFLMLAGCQTDGTGKGGTSAGTGADGGELKYVELDWYIGGAAPRDADMVFEELNKYFVEKINAKVNMHFVAHGEYLQKMNTVIGAGETFDLCYVNMTYLNPIINAQNGAFVALDELIPTYAPDILNEVPAWVLEGAKINGSLYTIPSYKDVADAYSLIYNKDMADAIGVDMTASWKTLGDLSERLYAFKQAKDAKYPENAKNALMSAFRTKGAWFPVDILVGAAVTNVGGIEFMQGKGAGETVFNLFETDEYRDAIMLQKKWVDDGIVAYDSKNYDPDGVLWKSGETPVRIGQGLVAINQHHYSEDWSVDLIRSDYAVSTTGYLHGAGTAVSVTSKNPERAVMLQNLVYADQYVATTMRFGLEGEDKHYVLDENGRVDVSKGLNADAKDRGFYRWYGAESGNLFKAILPASQPADLFESLKQMNEDAGQYETNLGFVINQDSIANEIAACANVIEEYDTPLMYGMVNDVQAHLNEFTAKLKANGVEKIIEECQRQLNEWRQANGKSVA